MVGCCYKELALGSFKNSKLDFLNFTFLFKLLQIFFFFSITTTTVAEKLGLYDGNNCDLGVSKKENKTVSDERQGGDLIAEDLLLGVWIVFAYNGSPVPIIRVILALRQKQRDQLAWSWRHDELEWEP